MQDNSRRGMVRYSDYQINPKFVLTVSRGIYFLTSIHQQRTKAPQKKKTESFKRLQTLQLQKIHRDPKTRRR